MENQDSSSRRAAQTRAKRATVVASLIGRQAPLGSGNDRSAELQTETSQNNSSPSLRSQAIGEVNVQHDNIFQLGYN